MTAPALEVMRLSKSFGGISAIADVSFTVPAGSLTALIGPNGAGKTTLFNLVTNLFQPDTGEVRFHGASLDGMPPHRIARLGLHRTFQTARVFPGMSALDNVLAGAHGQIRSGTLAQMLWLPGARREERALTAACDRRCSTSSGSRLIATCRRPACRWARRSSSSCAAP